MPFTLPSLHGLQALYAHTSLCLRLLAAGHVVESPELPRATGLQPLLALSLASLCALAVCNKPLGTP